MQLHSKARIHLHEPMDMSKHQRLHQDSIFSLPLLISPREKPVMFAILGRTCRNTSQCQLWQATSAPSIFFLWTIHDQSAALCRHCLEEQGPARIRPAMWHQGRPFNQTNLIICWDKMLLCIGLSPLISPSMCRQVSVHEGTSAERVGGPSDRGLAKQGVTRRREEGRKEGSLLIPGRRRGLMDGIASFIISTTLQQGGQ